jgi:hypothetical protein
MHRTLFPNAAIHLVALICCAAGLYGIDKPARTKIAEGSYVRKTTSGSERLDRWVLWRRADHTYQLSSLLFPDAGKSAGSTLEQLTDFDAGLKVQRFVLKGRHEKQSGSLSCELASNRLTCRADINGESSSGSTAVEGPYIVAPIQQGEYNDVPWIMAPMLRLATRDASTVTRFLYIIFWPGKNFEFEPLLPVEIHYSGKEKTHVMGRKVTAHRYEEMDDSITAWTADNGIVLAYELHGKDGYRVELVDFKQYEDFVPELK